jgi:hypothetical protein
MVMVGIQIALMPLGIKQGGFVDETIHMARIFGYADQFRTRLGLPVTGIQIPHLAEYMTPLGDSALQYYEQGRYYYFILESYRGFYWLMGALQTLVWGEWGIAERVYWQRSLSAIFAIASSAFFLMKASQLLHPSGKRNFFLPFLLLLTPILVNSLGVVSTDTYVWVWSCGILYFTLHLIQKGVRLLPVLGFAFVSTIAIFTKFTVAPMIAISALAVLFSLRKLRIPMAILVGIAGVTLLFTFGTRFCCGTAYWYLPSEEYLGREFLANRQTSPSEKFETYISVTETVALQQILPSRWQNAQGKQIAIFGWIRTHQAVSDSTEVVALSELALQGILLANSADWQPFWVQTTQVVSTPQADLRLLPTADFAQLKMIASADENELAALQKAFMQGDVLPHSLPNLLDNGDFSQGWLVIPGGVNDGIRQSYLNAVLDWRRTLPAFITGSRGLMSTFIASFSGYVPGLPRWAMLPTVSVLGLVVLYETFRIFFQKARLSTRWLSRFYIWLILFGYMGFGVFTILIFPSRLEPFAYASSRYLSASIIPLCLMICFTIWEFPLVNWRKWLALATIGFWLLLNAVMIFFIQLSYFTCPLTQNCIPW